MQEKDDKYTDPELRTEIKEKVQADDKGGKPGQWSARKAQMMASEYKKVMHERGEEPYTTDKSEQSESQKHLTDWTKEEWQTSEGFGDAKRTDGAEQRYLPKKAWESMSEEEKRATDEKKLEGSAAGEQYVPNTDAAKKARKDTQEDLEAIDVEDEDDGDEDKKQKSSGKEDGKSSKSPAKHGTKHKRADEGEESDDDGTKAGVGEEGEEDAAESQPAAKRAKGVDGEKRITRSQTKAESQSDADAKGEDEEEDNGGNDENGEYGQPGSATRLPEEGQKVRWRASPGWCDGSVVEILYSEKDVDGIHAKASKDEPRIVLKSSKSGKKAVHKPEAVYF